MNTKEIPKPMTAEESGQAFIVGILWKLANTDAPKWCPGKALYEAGCKMKGGFAFTSENRVREILVSLVDRDVIVEKCGRTRTAEFSAMQFRLSRWMYFCLKAAKGFGG